MRRLSESELFESFLVVSRPMDGSIIKTGSPISVAMRSRSPARRTVRPTSVISVNWVSPAEAWKYSRELRISPTTAVAHGPSA